MRNLFDKLQPSSAAVDPQGFKEAALRQLDSGTFAGAALWKFCADRGTAGPSRLTVDPNTWVSHSSAAGIITIGAAPMDPTTKARLLFHDERFTYADEVAYRLSHETSHGFLYLTQRDPRVLALRELNFAVRKATDGEYGLTALGSLAHYRGVPNKEIEDTTELMAMYTWGGPDYIREYTDFIAHPANERVVGEVGVAPVRDRGLLLAQIEAAVAGPLGL